MPCVWICKRCADHFRVDGTRVNDDSRDFHCELCGKPIKPGETIYIVEGIYPSRHWNNPFALSTSLKWMRRKRRRVRG
ncbi:MAG: hypothetical protein DRO40_10010 [Thermoprotei archaeon]|nr:MAG: hypothetical protein DRO40_10010 [Thermoprotei archaeon]